MWTGTLDEDGYGVLSVAKKRRRAHRISYELHIGPIPSGVVVCHRCDRPGCVRPDCLFLGTIADNNRDRDLKGRSARGESHHNSKLTNDAVREMRRLRAEHLARNPSHSKWRNDPTTPGTYRALAARFGVTEAAVEFVCTGKWWRHVS